jgi:muconolactone delta-isomerase
MEFLVHMKVAQIDGGEEREKQLREQEAACTRELAKQGILSRLWRVPGRRENWGIWRADDCDLAPQCTCLIAALRLSDHYRASSGIASQRSRDAILSPGLVP